MVLLDGFGLLDLLVGLGRSLWAAWSLGPWRGDLDSLLSCELGGVGDGLRVLVVAISCS